MREDALDQPAEPALRKYINRERPGLCNIGYNGCSNGNTGYNDYVFLSRDGCPLSVRMLQQLVSELGNSAGVPNVHPHRFRHTFAVNQLLAGTSDLVLMGLMGHTTLEATKIYVRAMSQEQARKSAVSVMDRMSGRHAR